MIEDSIALLAREKQEIILRYVGEEARRRIERVVNRFMEAERDRFLGCAAYERTPSRRGRRNGFDPRRLDSRWGPLRLSVPKVREAGGRKFRSEAIVRYRRRQGHLERCVLEWVAAGMPTRAVSRAMQRAFGAVLSAATVSRIVAEIDEERRAFHQRRFERGFRYLFVDAKHWKVCRRTRRRGRGVARKAVLLLAWGIGHDGRERLIDFRVAPDESEASWDGFLRELGGRGVVEKNRWDERLERIISDGGGGIEAAVALNYPGTAHQACVFHKIENLAGHLQQREKRAAIQGGAAAIFQAPTRLEATARLRRWETEWRRQEPEAVRHFVRDADRMLLFYEAPVGLRRRVKTTNPLERFIRELDRKYEQVGPFATVQSWERLTYLVYRDRFERGYAPFRREHHFTRNS